MNHKPETGNNESATKLTVITSTAQQTRELSRHIGEHLDQPALIRMTGDLGSGKTCFVQGLAAGLDVPDGYAVTSPTYSLIHEYRGRLSLVHVDLYRIQDEMDAENIGLGEIIGQDCVTAVEWSDRLADDYWPQAPTLTIEFQVTTEGKRRISIIGYGLQISVLIKKVGTLIQGSIADAD